LRDAAKKKQEDLAQIRKAAEELLEKGISVTTLLAVWSGLHDGVPDSRAQPDPASTALTEIVTPQSTLHFDAPEETMLGNTDDPIFLASDEVQSNPQSISLSNNTVMPASLFSSLAVSEPSNHPLSVEVLNNTGADSYAYDNHSFEATASQYRFQDPNTVGSLGHFDEWSAPSGQPGYSFDKPYWLDDVGFPQAFIDPSLLAPCSFPASDPREKIGHITWPDEMIYTHTNLK
jgi:hypothetical protein